MSDFGAEHSFGKSCQRIKEHDGFEINATAVRETTLEHAGRAREQLEAHYQKNFRELPQKGPAVIVAQTDGTMICTVAAGRGRKDARPLEWKEMRLNAARAHGREKACYAAGFTNVEQTGRRLAHCARDAGWALESRLHVVADGAEWIRIQTREIFGDQAELLGSPVHQPPLVPSASSVDFYHVSEYLAAAAAAIRPGAERAWLRTQQKRRKRGAHPAVLEALGEHEEEPSVPEEKAPVRAAKRDLTHRRDHLDYPRAIQAGVPIGSGLIESGHKHVLQARLKQPGAAWNPHNAHAIAQLRILRINSQWESFWPSSFPLAA